MKCRKCSYQYDDSLGIYGCPNCHGKGIDDKTWQEILGGPKTPAARRAKADAKKRAAGLVRLQVWVTPEQREKMLAVLGKHGYDQ